jgi:peptidoglycan/LPS O-acetylase OafA/YrhL
MAHQGWYEANFAHFWSLAVEEQFYICWPWLVLFLPRKWLLPAILAVVAIGPLYRWSYVLSHYQNMTGLSTYISAPTSLDHLGFGALLALAVQRLKAQMIIRFTLIAFPVSLLASFTLMKWTGGDTKIIFFDATSAVALCCLVFWASRGFNGPIGRFLEWKPILYVGKISYGLYVYHPLMPGLAIWLLLQFGMKFNEYTFPVTVLGLVLTFAITSASWHLFEKPINDLKRFF